jgi:nucleotide-binding universal stress UspA family protein
MSASRSVQPTRIVVGVNGSTASRAAVRWAVEHAHPGDTVTLVHVREPSRFVVGDGLARDDADAASQFVHRELEHAMALPRDDRVTLSCRARQGDPRELLLAEEADLLVVGAGEHGRMLGAVIGSVSAKLGRGGRIPIVVVPSPGQTTARAGRSTG